MKFDNAGVHDLFKRSLKQAETALEAVSVWNGARPAFSGLSGWVFEQTVQWCLRQEASSAGVHLALSQHERLRPKVLVDLVVQREDGTRIFIEIKARGLFSMNDAEKYKNHAGNARAQKSEFLFLTLGESYEPYADAIRGAIGSENCFFLDRDGDWARFVGHVLHLAQCSDAAS